MDSWAFGLCLACLILEPSYPTHGFSYFRGSFGDISGLSWNYREGFRAFDCFREVRGKQIVVQLFSG